MELETAALGISYRHSTPGRFNISSGTDELLDELVDVRWRRVLGQPLLLRLVEALDLAAGLNIGPEHRREFDQDIR